ncbi:hypothetical protein KV395_13910 [Microbacterium luteolum]|uniref:Uncharacterized protein n=1 Tax=Microbacterium luteolum TaxID=69367 RepID=A0ABY7XVZ9_MICLT|nr:hypothetical protein [Microbacterium luteolum]WDM45694.1 hypothetical protein KV395_13910 [Microbacterium luteolum]
MARSQIAAEHHEKAGESPLIDQVMADAAGLVSIRHTLRQLVNVKGD